MRSFVLLAALVVLASANPWGLSGQGNRNPFQSRNALNTLLQRSWIQQQSPAQQAAQQIKEQIQKAETVNNGQQLQGLNTVYAQDVIQSAVAQQTAQEVLQQALLARQRQTVQGIQELQSQLNVQDVNGGIGQGVQQVSTLEAIKNLQQWLRIQQLLAPQILINSQLTQTLQTVIQAQLASENLALNEVGTSGIVGLNSQAFQAKVQQLIDISNIKEIEVEILNQQAVISQLQLQQQLVAEQIQQIQSQQSTVSIQLQNVVVELQQQGQQLTVEILARRLVIQQLQQALVDQQQQLQQNVQQVQEIRSITQQAGLWNVPSGIQQRTESGLNKESRVSSQTLNPLVARWSRFGYLPIAGRQSIVGSV